MRSERVHERVPTRVTVEGWAQRFRRWILEQASGTPGRLSEAEVKVLLRAHLQKRHRVYNLNRFAERGYFILKVESCGYWRDDGLHRMNDYDEVDPNPVGSDAYVENKDCCYAMEEPGLFVKRARVVGEWIITKPVLTPAIEADFRISSKVWNLYKELRFYPLVRAR